MYRDYLSSVVFTNTGNRLPVSTVSPRWALPTFVVRHFLRRKQSQCLLVMDNSTVLSGLLHVNLTISKEKPQHFRLSFEHHRHKQREGRTKTQKEKRSTLLSSRPSHAHDPPPVLCASWHDSVCPRPLGSSASLCRQTCCRGEAIASSAAGRQAELLSQMCTLRRPFFSTEKLLGLRAPSPLGSNF